MSECSCEAVSKETVKQILQKILDIYKSDDTKRKADFFEKELPNFIESGDFTYNPKKATNNLRKEN
jgi:hypothetical protein